jgi:2-desacetyl-2-hydroxyethyl bacteriochlorophyllide A dehydrogenase
MAPEARALYFTKPGQVELREEPLLPQPGQVRVRSRLMGISHGTELLAFRGQLPTALEADSTLKGLPGRLAYPLKYGYSNCGVVEEAGPRAGARPAPGAGQRPAPGAGQRVFAFYPHQDRFDADPGELLPLPPGVSDEQAVFLPNLETALGIVHDAGVRFGESVLVVGLGVVGLLVSALLLQSGVALLIAVEPLEKRRRRAEALGCRTFSSQEARLRERIAELTGGRGPDAAVNCSGSEAGLQLGLDTLCFEGTQVEASWYGSRRVSLELGAAFHRRRLRLVSSQVSRVAAALGPRWDKRRRLEMALALLPALDPSGWITHRFKLECAQEAFELLDRCPQDVLQVVLEP